MKLVIQIPAFNEEAMLPRALDSITRQVPGFTDVAVLVIDDGSTDSTADVARQSGADRVVRLPAHRGLAAAFSAGLEEALAMGADVIVNFDADLQYDAADIPALVAPILAGTADLVVGDRGPGTLAHFSPGKRFLQRLGSWVVRQASGLQVADAASGFRALSREAARRMNVFSRMTYSLETLIQAGWKDLRVASVPVRAHPPTRPSRLFTSAGKYVLVQGANVLRITALYKPLKIFSAAAVIFLFAGLAIGIRFLVYYFLGKNPGGHVQSLILAAVLIVVGAQTFLIALLADLVAINRTLLEELKLRETGNGKRETGNEEPKR
ncbi:MAG TPA: glycosyltransferase family 2 protein [Thermoanaerobaculia bacterium]|jgi:glycosyltransferase involved in cell wall biosynthesis|nr:glycosyltransferase family 2 protein [Thermoanaerobaculia bacterium]